MAMTPLDIQRLLSSHRDIASLIAALVARRELMLAIIKCHSFRQWHRGRFFIHLKNSSLSLIAENEIFADY